MKRETRAKQNLVSALPKRRDELIRILLEQAEQIDLLRQENESLRKKDDRQQKRIQDANKQIDDLRKQLEEAQRAAHRQAVPFRRPSARPSPSHPANAPGIRALAGPSPITSTRP